MAVSGLLRLLRCHEDKKLNLLILDDHPAVSAPIFTSSRADTPLFVIQRGWRDDSLRGRISIEQVYQTRSLAESPVTLRSRS
jgi:hypothetical protein